MNEIQLSCSRSSTRFWITNFNNMHSFQTSEIDGGQLQNDEPSIFAQLERGLKLSPHKPAVICMHQPGTHLEGLITEGNVDKKKSSDSPDCLTLTYNQVYRTALRLALGFRESGIHSGSTVLLAVENGGEYVLLLWACAILKLTIVAIDPSLLEPSRKAELRDYIESLRPKVVVVPSTNGIESFENAAESAIVQPSLYVTLSGEDLAIGRISLRQVILKGDRAACDEEPLIQSARQDDPERVHAILFTSGTSGGMPKGCAVRVRSMTHILEAQSWLIHLGNCSRVLQQAHISRAIGPQHMLQTWRCGGTIIMPGPPSFAVEHTVEAILKFKASFIVLSPSMVHALANQLDYPGAGDSVRSIQVGGDAVAKQVMHNCKELFPNADVFVNHGMSEGGSVFRWPFFDTKIDDIPFFGGICPTGAVSEGTKVKIWNDERNIPVPRGEAGCLHLLSNSLIANYMDNRSSDSFYEDAEGHWFNTGDMALMNDDGIVYILGRAKDALEQDGKVLMPSVLESCIETFTGRQSKAVSLGSRSRYERPVAVLSDLENVDLDELHQVLLQELGKEYIPSKVVSLQDIGLTKFPVNATHKVIKEDLQRAIVNTRIM